MFWDSDKFFLVFLMLLWESLKSILTQASRRMLGAWGRRCCPHAPYTVSIILLKWGDAAECWGSCLPRAWLWGSAARHPPTWVCRGGPPPALMGRELEDCGPTNITPPHPAMEDKPPSRSPSPPHSLATLLPVNLSISTSQALVVVSTLPPSITSTPISVTPVLLTSDAPSPPLSATLVSSEERLQEASSSVVPSSEPVRTTTSAPTVLRHSVAGDQPQRPVLRRGRWGPSCPFAHCMTVAATAAAATAAAAY